MKTIGVICSEREVRANLSGARTMMRTVMRKQPPSFWGRPPAMFDGEYFNRYGFSRGPDSIKSPLLPGDQFYMRETWGLMWPESCENGLVYDDGNELYGRPLLDHECDVKRKATEPDTLWYSEDAKEEDGSCTMWKSPAIMPAWSARPWRGEVLAVKAERLQEISEGDVWKEGFRDRHNLDQDVPIAARHHFSDAWIARHGAESWDRNPWVWAIEFKGVRP